MVAIAKCQRGKQKHEDNRKAVQEQRTGALFGSYSKQMMWLADISIIDESIRFYD